MIQVVLQFFDSNGDLYSDEEYYTITRDINRIKREVHDEFPYLRGMNYVAEVIDDNEAKRYLVLDPIK